MTYKECITLLKDMKTIYFEFKKDKTRLLNNMKPSVRKLHNGNEVFKQTADYVYAEDYDRAITYLRKAIRTSRFWPLSKINYGLGGMIWLVLGLTVFGIFLLILGICITDLAKESTHWPTVTGVITNSYYYKDADEDGDLSWVTVTEYSYSVYGKEYQSDKRNIGGLTGFSEEREADSIVRKYPKDALVTVWYNPDKHKTAVLEPGLDDKFHIVFYMGILFFSLGFLMFIIPFIIALLKILKAGKR